MNSAKKWELDSSLGQNVLKMIGFLREICRGNEILIK